MAGRGEGELDPAELEPVAVVQGLQAGPGFRAEAGAHDLEGAGGGEHMGAAGPGMIAMAMGHHRALDRGGGIDGEAAGLADQPARRRLQPVLCLRHCA